MTEIRVVAPHEAAAERRVLVGCAPIRLRRVAPSLAQTTLLPFRRGLVFVAALSLPLLGSALADRFHGGASGSGQAAAVPWPTPRTGTAARILPLGNATLALRLAQRSGPTR